jgi:hypothetical protein
MPNGLSRTIDALGETEFPLFLQPQRLRKSMT